MASFMTYLLVILRREKCKNCWKPEGNSSNKGPLDTGREPRCAELKDSSYSTWLGAFLATSGCLTPRSIALDRNPANLGFNFPEGVAFVPARHVRQSLLQCL